MIEKTIILQEYNKLLKEEKYYALLALLEDNKNNKEFYTIEMLERTYQFLLKENEISHLLSFVMDNRNNKEFFNTNRLIQYYNQLIERFNKLKKTDEFSAKMGLTLATNILSIFKDNKDFCTIERLDKMSGFGYQFSILIEHKDNKDFCTVERLVENFNFLLSLKDYSKLLKLIRHHSDNQEFMKKIKI